MLVIRHLHRLRKLQINCANLFRHFFLSLEIELKKERKSVQAKKNIYVHNLGTSVEYTNHMLRMWVGLGLYISLTYFLHSYNNKFSIPKVLRTNPGCRFYVIFHVCTCTALHCTALHYS